MPGLPNDLRCALRLVTKSPGFGAVAILTLAVGIGANTAIFSVANALLLRPLPYTAPDRLVVISAEQKKSGTRGGPLSWPRFEFTREHSRSLAGLAAFTPEVFNLTGLGDPEQVRAARVSWNFLDVLGVAPALGRTFRTEEDRPGGDPVVLVSASFWTRRFAGDHAAVGRHVTLDSKDYTIIGVLPPDFRFGFFGSAVDIVAPRVFDLNLITPQQANGGTMFLTYVARLAPGVTIRQAQSEIDALSSRYRRENPKLPDADPSLIARVDDLRDGLVASARPAVLILFGAVGLVLLIACANVGSIVLSRSLGRTREIAVRKAVGATRVQIVRQLVVESLVLALAGGALGTALSAWGVKALAALAGDNLPRAAEIGTDLPVLGFALAVSLIAGILFGLTPALQVSRSDVSAALRAEGRGATAGRRRNRLRGALVVAQVALSMVLLVAAGLLLRNFVQLRTASAGFVPRGLLTMKITLPPARYPGGAKMTAFFDELLPAVRAVPGVGAAAISSALPANPVRFSPALPEGQPEVPLLQRPLFNIQTISPGYAGTMRLPLVRGREFSPHDDAKAPRVVIVNELVARRYWPGQDPIGKHILLGRIVQPCEVVGVFGDIRNLSLSADVQPEIYLPFAQLPWPAMNLVVRTAGDPHRLVSAVRARIFAIDRDQPVTAIQTMDEVLETAAAQPRFTTYPFGSLSAIALLLALVGIYGVIAYSVAERTQEMGIRMALGARQADVLRLVLRQTLLMAMTGIAIGLAGSFALTRLLSGMLYRVSTTDPPTFVAAVLLFTMMAVIAGLVPSERATRIDPIVALRGD